MRRRDLITLLAGAAAWPHAAGAQQPALPVIGFLHTTSASSYAYFVAAFRRGLNEAGYVEGQNVAIEYRGAEGQFDRLPALAADLVSRRVSVIAAAPMSAALAAKRATSTIPIVFTSGGDPVEFGLVASLNRPGGNITGVFQFAMALMPKRLEILREVAPKDASIAVLVRPNASSGSMLKELQAAATAVGQQIEVLNAQDGREIDAAVSSVVNKRVGALMLAPDPLFSIRRVQIVTLAARNALPTLYVSREFAEAGGLMSYGTNIEDVYRQMGAYTGRVLKGEKPADLPVVQPTKYELVLNLNTARALRIEVPPTLLARADEVIE
jgi:putative ABC transport system substrate-binding protein